MLETELGRGVKHRRRRIVKEELTVETGIPILFLTSVPFKSVIDLVL